jgi:hypothetical protein
MKCLNETAWGLNGYVCVQTGAGPVNSNAGLAAGLTVFFVLTAAITMGGLYIRKQQQPGLGEDAQEKLLKHEALGSNSMSNSNTRSRLSGSGGERFSVVDLAGDEGIPLQNPAGGWATPGELVPNTVWPSLSALLAHGKLITPNQIFVNFIGPIALTTLTTLTALT